MTAPTSKDPGGTALPGRYRRATRPPHARTARAPTTRPISGLNRPARDTRCLRFARRVAPPGRKTRFRLLARLYRVGSRPTGFLRKVSSMLLTSLSSFPRLTLAQTRFGREVRSRQGWFLGRLGVGSGSGVIAVASWVWCAELVHLGPDAGSPTGWMRGLFRTDGQTRLRRELGVSLRAATSCTSLRSPTSAA